MSLKYVGVVISHPHYPSLSYIAADRFTGLVKGLEHLFANEIGKVIGGGLILEMVAAYKSGEFKKIPLLNYISMIYKNTRIFRREGEELPTFEGSESEFLEYNDPDTLNHENFTLENTILHVSPELMTLLPFDEASAVPKAISYSFFMDDGEIEEDSQCEMKLKKEGSASIPFYQGTSN